MRLLYIVEMDNGWTYDDHGTYVLGVFTTRDKAIQAAKDEIIKASIQEWDGQPAMWDRTFAVIHETMANTSKGRSNPTIIQHDLTITTQRE